MRLHWSPRSPFVRKVMAAAHGLGLADRIERVRTVARLTGPNPELLPDNLLGCCLSYLDFRFPDLGRRAGRPALAAWHEGCRARPSAQATEIVDA